MQFCMSKKRQCTPLAKPSKDRMSRQCDRGVNVHSGFSTSSMPTALSRARGSAPSQFSGMALPSLAPSSSASSSLVMSTCTGNLSGTGDRAAQRKAEQSSSADRQSAIWSDFSEYCRKTGITRADLPTTGVVMS